MQDWTQKLRDAKIMLEEGLIDEVEFQEIKNQAMKWMTDSGAEQHPSLSHEHPKVLGSYQIIEPLGEGGMGVDCGGVRGQEPPPPLPGVKDILGMP